MSEGKDFTAGMTSPVYSVSEVRPPILEKWHTPDGRGKPPQKLKVMMIGEIIITEEKKTKSSPNFTSKGDFSRTFRGPFLFRDNQERLRRKISFLKKNFTRTACIVTYSHKRI